MSGEAKDGHTPEEVEQALYVELEKLRSEPVPPEELQKVKNQFAAGEYRKLSSNFPIFFGILQNEGLGDWKEVNESGARIQAVTVADVQRVIGKYLRKENRAIAVYTRKPGTGGADQDPDLAGLTPEQLPVIRRVLASLETEQDAAKLKTSLAAMEAQAQTGDPKRQQFQKILRKKLAERIAVLEKK